MPIKPFNKTPTDILAQNEIGQTIERSSSRRRSREYIEAVIAKVNMQYGIRMRVKRKRPTHVARHSPAYIPAFLPKAHSPNRSTSQQRRTENKASGIRAAQSWTPNT